MKRRSFLALLGCSPLAPAALPDPTRYLTATAVRVLNEKHIFPPFPPGWLVREIPCRTTYAHALLYGPPRAVE